MHCMKGGTEIRGAIRETVSESAHGVLYSTMNLQYFL